MIRKYQITISQDGGLAGRFEGDREDSNISMILHPVSHNEDEATFEEGLQAVIEDYFNTVGRYSS